MNKAKSIFVFVAMLACLGASCAHKIRRTSFIVSPALISQPGISEGGKLRWVASSKDVTFKVHLFPTASSPCRGAVKNDLPGAYGRPASCTILSGIDGLYGYSISKLTPLNASALAVPLDARAADSTDSMQYFHIDACPFCAKTPPPSQTPTSFMSATGAEVNLVVISCEHPPTAVAAPSSLGPVYQNQVVQWAPLGPETTPWTTELKSASICIEGTKFGTGTPHSACTIKPDAASGSYTYTLTYGGASCAGSANLTIGKPSTTQ